MAEESNGAALPELCSKCGERPQRGSHSWCRQCRTEAQQRYNAEREKMIEARGFAAGVAALLSTAARGGHTGTPAALEDAREALACLYFLMQARPCSRHVLERLFVFALGCLA